MIPFQHQHINLIKTGSAMIVFKEKIPLLNRIKEVNT